MRTKPSLRYVTYTFPMVFPVFQTGNPFFSLDNAKSSHHQFSSADVHVQNYERLKIRQTPRGTRNERCIESRIPPWSEHRPQHLYWTENQLGNFPCAYYYSEYSTFAWDARRYSTSWHFTQDGNWVEYSSEKCWNPGDRVHFEHWEVSCIFIAWRIVNKGRTMWQYRLVSESCPVSYNMET